MSQISFEFFPPRTERGRTNLVATAQRLAAFRPAFYSVTYGAAGSTRDRTFATVADLRAAGINAAPHLSWGSDDEDGLVDFLGEYLHLGVDRVVALRGDVPSGIGTTREVRHAEDLVRLIRARIDAPLVVEVAAYPEVHPEAGSAARDIHFLKRKVDAGADGCITQYFYNVDAYFHFRDRCVAGGIDVPIVPGVMPITNFDRLKTFSEKAGVDIPRWLRIRLAEFEGDDDGLRAFGGDVVTALCARLLEGGAPGIHFYTLNKAAPTSLVAGNLGL